MTTTVRIRVDPNVQFCDTRMVSDPKQTLPVIREAATKAFRAALGDDREPVMVEVRIWVKP